MKGLQLKLAVSVLVVVFAGVPLVSAFSAPITSPVVVLFGHSPAELTVAEQIHKDFPNSIVVDYGSLPAFLILFRAVGQVVFVAHGSPEGVASPFGLLSWASVARAAESTPAHVRYLAACYSSNAVALLSVRAVGFLGFVDADLAAIAISTLMWYAQGAVANAQQTLSRFYAVALAKCLDPSLVQPLYFGPTEGLGYTIDAVVWIVGFILGACIADGYIKERLKVIAATLVPKIGGWLADVAMGALSPAGFLVDLLICLGGDILPQIGDVMSPVDIGIIAVQIACFFIPILGQIALAIWLVLALVDLARILVNLANDCNDADDAYGTTLPPSSGTGNSQTPPSGGGGGGGGGGGARYV